MLSSIRWKILLTFLIIIGASFAMMAALLTGLVSSTLYAQRTRQDSLSVERLAASAAPFFASARMEELHETLSTAASELGGRLIVVSPDGKVQLDTFALLEGTKLTLPEVVTALTGEVSHAYGIYPAQSSGEYAALCAARMTSGNETIGALLLSTPVTELRNAIVTVEQQLLTVFIAVAAAAMIAALVFALTLTRPVKALTSAIRRMGRGDLSARVKVRASGEMKELADSYNAMAEKIENFDRSRSQFVSNASHELKTPLATMKILLENLIYQPEMPKDLQVEFMQDMNHEIDRLTGIINDLLTLTQMDSQSTALTEEEVDLSGLTEETLHTLRAAAARAGQQISDRIEPDVTLTGDRSKLGQIIYNLIDNAIKFSHNNSVIWLETYERYDKVFVSVRDTGIGIPKESQKKIWDRFYKTDQSRGKDKKGTGLGLSIVKEIIQAHGQNIDIISTVGVGTEFIFTLPKASERDNG